jgi:hypothetical protein
MQRKEQLQLSTAVLVGAWLLLPSSDVPLSAGGGRRCRGGAQRRPPVSGGGEWCLPPGLPLPLRPVVNLLLAAMVVGGAGIGQRLEQEIAVGVGWWLDLTWTVARVELG